MNVPSSAILMLMRRGMFCNILECIEYDSSLYNEIEQEYVEEELKSHNDNVSGIKLREYRRNLYRSL